ncbi:hypothetical protein CFC21_085073 [Triticum aestivum]|uniref:Uncharacterized protein n=3 Tax=Triticum TaxID=4564 RepID=A0A9R1B472_TRITD|nr:hypothetical protein CFC21_085073 [Triticum aestivum]VAI50863.1 unnamed protein product [Triticum turgidum subsp. durum]
MRSCSSSHLSLAAAVVLLLVLTAAMEAEGIRLDAETRASVGSSSSNPVHNKPSDSLVKGSTTSSVSESETTRSAGAVKEAAGHGLPEFHEDYYVRTAHSSRHH